MRIPNVPKVFHKGASLPLIHLHYRRGVWRATEAFDECAPNQCVPAIARDDISDSFSKVSESMDVAVCAQIGHLDFEYEAGSYCGRCGIELSRRDVCRCGHPEIEHGVVTTAGQYSVSSTYPNACKRFGCNDCLAYEVAG